MIAPTEITPPRTLRRLDIDRPFTRASEGHRRLGRVRSNLVGIAHRTFEQLRDVDDVALTGVGARACSSRILLGSECNELNGGGSPDPRQATAATIGETVERYSVAWCDRSELVLATADDIARRGVRAVGPEDLRLFDESQFRPGFPFVPFERSTPLEWVWAATAGSDEPILVPAQLIYMREQVSGPLIGYATSNGLACACTHEEAVLSGLLELLERDAFMSTWYGELTLPLIDPRSDAGFADFWDRHVASSGLGVRLIDLSTLVDAPVVLAVVRNDATPIAPVALGAAAATTGATAARKAVIEAFQTRTWAKAEQREGAELSPTNGFDQVRSFDDHVRLSLHPDYLPHTRFLDASTRSVTFSTMPDLDAPTPGAAVLEIIGRLDRQGVQAHVLDVTSPDIASADLCVAKVFAPALCPLDSGFGNRFLGPDRLRTRAHEVGLGEPIRSVCDLNPVPHPFP